MRGQTRGQPRVRSVGHAALMSQPTTWQYNGTIVLITAAAMLIPLSAQAASKKWIAMLPPLKYDYLYQGQLTIARGILAVMNAVCAEVKLAKFALPYACSRIYRRTNTPKEAPADICHVFIAEDNLLLPAGWIYKDVLRHELGHCNGWGGHDRGRAPPAPSGKPPVIPTVKPSPGPLTPEERYKAWSGETS
jgi:hypothetical protein